MNDILNEINYYYYNYNIYRTIIIITDLFDLKLFKSFINTTDYSLYIINNEKDISKIDDRLILININNTNLQTIINQTTEYNLLLFYNKIKNIQIFFLLN